MDDKTLPSLDAERKAYGHAKIQRLMGIDLNPFGFAFSIANTSETDDIIFVKRGFHFFENAYYQKKGKYPNFKFKSESYIDNFDYFEAFFRDEKTKTIEDVYDIFKTKYKVSNEQIEDWKITDEGINDKYLHYIRDFNNVKSIKDIAKLVLFVGKIMAARFHYQDQIEISSILSIMPTMEKIIDIFSKKAEPDQINYFLVKESHFLVMFNLLKHYKNNVDPKFCIWDLLHVIFPETLKTLSSGYHLLSNTEIEIERFIENNNLIDSTQTVDYIKLQSFVSDLIDIFVVITTELEKVSETNATILAFREILISYVTNFEINWRTLEQHLREKFGIYFSFITSENIYRGTYHLLAADKDVKEVREVRDRLLTYLKKNDFSNLFNDLKNSAVQKLIDKKMKGTLREKYNWPRAYGNKVIAISLQKFFIGENYQWTYLQAIFGMYSIRRESWRHIFELSDVEQDIYTEFVEQFKIIYKKYGPMHRVIFTARNPLINPIKQEKIEQIFEERMGKSIYEAFPEYKDLLATDHKLRNKFVIGASTSFYDLLEIDSPNQKVIMVDTIVKEMIEKSKNKTYNIDHIIPQSIVTINQPQNLILTNTKTNLAKGSLSAIEYKYTTGKNVDGYVGKLEDQIAINFDNALKKTHIAGNKVGKQYIDFYSNLLSSFRQRWRGLSAPYLEYSTLSYNQLANIETNKTFHFLIKMTLGNTIKSLNQSFPAEEQLEKNTKVHFYWTGLITKLIEKYSSFGKLNIQNFEDLGIYRNLIASSINLIFRNDRDYIFSYRALFPEYITSQQFKQYLGEQRYVDEYVEFSRNYILRLIKIIDSVMYDLPVKFKFNESRKHSIFSSYTVSPRKNKLSTNTEIEPFNVTGTDPIFANYMAIKEFQASPKENGISNAKQIIAKVDGVYRPIYVDFESHCFVMRKGQIVFINKNEIEKLDKLIQNTTPLIAKIEKLTFIIHVFGTTHINGTSQICFNFNNIPNYIFMLKEFGIDKSNLKIAKFDLDGTLVL